MVCQYRILPTLFLIGIMYASAAAQTAADVSYERLYPAAPIPAGQDMRRLPDIPEDLVDKPSRRAVWKKYEQQNRFYLTELLQSHRVLSQDTVSRYLGGVVNKVMAAHPEIKRQLRIYALRATDVNAFSSADGTLLINLGLIAALDNEAQLAFVICHEISHYLQQHSLRYFLQQQSPLAVYPLAPELEADSVGLALYLAAGYPASEVLAALRCMNPGAMYWHTDSIPITIPGYPERYLPPPSQVVSDSLSLLRIERIARQLPPATSPLADTSRAFRYVRFRAQYECAWLYLEKRAYEQAIYAAVCLRHLYQDAPILDFVAAYGWYGLAMYEAEGRIWDVRYPAGPGMLQPLTRAVDSLTGVHIAITALEAATTAYLKQPDTSLLLMIYDLKKLVCNQDSALTGWQADTWRRSGQLLRLPSCQYLTSHLPRDTTAAFLQDSEMLLNGLPLGLDSLLILPVTYERLDMRQDVPLDVPASEAAADRITHQLVADAATFDMTLAVLAQDSVSSGDLTVYRHLQCIQMWMEEQLLHGEIQMVSLYREELRQIAAWAPCRYVGRISVRALAQPRKGRILVGVVGILLPPALPYSLYYILSPEWNTRITLQIFDLEAQRWYVYFPRHIRLRDTPDLTRGVIFDLLYQIHQNP